MNIHKSPLILILIALANFSGPALAMEAHTDNRRAITLDNEAREHVLLEMRQLLEAVHHVLNSALEQDMHAVTKHAGAVGLKAMKATPPAVASQLPMEFKMMGKRVHEAMDNIARDARDLGDSQHVIEQVNETLGTCVACHATFKLN